MKKSMILLSAVLIAFSACKKEDKNVTTTPTTTQMGKDPATAEVVSVDRFSSTAGMLMVRDANNGLPGPNVAINYDQAPFITKGLGPSGQMVEYYNFDVQSTTPAPIYVLFKEGSTTPVDGQLNIINVIPGDAGYNDFWQVVKVAVPADYVANLVTSYSEIVEKGYATSTTDMLVNCPVVPKGSTANKKLGGGANQLTMGWYKGKVVHYFSFEEKKLMGSTVPVSPIYVTFNINPNMMGGGPASGFVSEMGNMQTHNVVATIPSDASYSPLWLVNVYDNMDFANVGNLSQAQMANILATGVANVNCPIVSIQ
ncbi:MAG: hypothetical protein H6551_11270 [Chitinophagales bacterium]|nr:hypothetical protein [Chitinophagaceae bacterium]MCB9065706.1 hypothetical protein [Chitinophagales bacterium]